MGEKSDAILLKGMAFTTTGHKSSREKDSKVS